MRAFAVVMACLIALAAAVPGNMMEDRMMRRQCVRLPRLQTLCVRIRVVTRAVSLTCVMTFSFATKIIATVRIAVQMVLAELSTRKLLRAVVAKAPAD